MVLPSTPVQSASFSEEKEAKRLLFIWAAGVPIFRLSGSKVFAPLFSKSGRFA
jgi:hypothetical protein